jgi:AraC family transcriptional regulator, activator of mtrCDE
MPASELNDLMAALEVDFVKLAECLINPGWRLVPPTTDMCVIHYNLAGHGWLAVRGEPPVPLTPHTLVILPPGRPFEIAVAPASGKSLALKTVEPQTLDFEPGALRRLVVGDGEPEFILIYGYFRASFASSIDLFSLLAAPIVEKFDPADQLDHKLKSVLSELAAQDVGSRAMSTALLKQVLVTLLRRSLSSPNLWVERFSMLSDPQIARAFSDMVARPGAPHSVQSLSYTSGLSRSAFMSRFAEAFGNSPMRILRQLRMRYAARMLTADTMSIDQIANAAGYASRSSFFRAFLKAHNCDPSDYRTAATRSSGRMQ